jgi:biotin carboxyl carrier protein
MIGARALLRSVGGVLLGLSLATGAWAHGGHEEEDAVSTTALGISSAPRLAAHSDDFELVAIAHGRNLTIYLDRYADNRPIADARIEVDVNGETVVATAIGDGTYQLAANWVATPGDYDPLFTVFAGDLSDLLTAKLVIPSAEATAAAGPGRLATAGGSLLNLAVAFLLGMFVMWLVPFVRKAVPAGTGAALGAQAARSAATMRVAAQSGAATSRKLAADYGPAVRRARRRFATQATAVFDRLRGWAATSGPVQASVLRTVRARVAPAAGAASLTLLSVGIFMVALLLAYFGSAVLAHSAPVTVADAAKPAAAAVPAPAKVPEPLVGARRLLDGTLFMPKAIQRLLDVQTVVAQTGEAMRSLRVAGQVIADPGTSGQIHSTIKGRLVAQNGVWPRVGQSVVAGEILAWVVPVLNPIDRGIIFAQLAQIDHEVALAEDRITRLTAPDSKASALEIDNARSDLSNLSRRRASIALVLRDRDTLRAPLLAPADGVVAASYSVAGQLVDEQQKLFEVVNPKRLWVEAHAYDITAIGDVTGADAVSSIGRNYKLKFISRGPQLRQQTIPLYFQIEAPDSSISVGSVVSVLLQAAERRQGLIVPRGAVVKDTAGQSIVWQHVGAETFTPLPVRFESVDADQVLIVAGLKPSTRIVVNSASLLSEFR